MRGGGWASCSKSSILEEIKQSIIICYLFGDYNFRSDYMKRRITEQNQPSMSLSQQTVLNQYNNLDYSDECQSSHSSNDHSLSRSHQQEMLKLNEISKIHKKQFEDSSLNIAVPRKSNDRAGTKMKRDLESKYDFGISPSTKQEYSLLNPPPRLSNQSQPSPTHFAINYNHTSKYKNHHQYAPASKQPQQFYAEASSEYSKQGKLINEGASKNRYLFDIDNFLNAQPVPLKNKKGVNILTESKQQRIKQKYRVPQKQMIKEEESIVLVTLPEYPSLSDYSANKQFLSKAIRKQEMEDEKISGNYDAKFKEVRLNFIDTFLPESMKIKSNAYNLLKYIHKKPY